MWLCGCRGAGGAGGGGVGVGAAGQSGGAFRQGGEFGWTLAQDGLHPAADALATRTLRRHGEIPRHSRIELRFTAVNNVDWLNSLANAGSVLF